MSALHGLVSASVCLVEMQAAPPYPLPHPARSINRAAATLTAPSSASTRKWGTWVCGPQRSAPWR